MAPARRRALLPIADEMRGAPSEDGQLGLVSAAGCAARHRTWLERSPRGSPKPLVENAVHDRRAERKERGRAARREVPHGALGSSRPPADADAVTLLGRTVNVGRVPTWFRFAVDDAGLAPSPSAGAGFPSGADRVPLGPPPSGLSLPHGCLLHTSTIHHFGSGPEVPSPPSPLTPQFPPLPSSSSPFPLCCSWRCDQRKESAVTAGQRPPCVRLRQHGGAAQADGEGRRSPQDHQRPRLSSRPATPASRRGWTSTSGWKGCSVTTPEPCSRTVGT